MKKRLPRYEFVEGLPKFYKSIKRLAKKFKIAESDIYKEMYILRLQPRKGNVIPKYNIFRKVYIPIPGVSGGSNGFRFLYSLNEDRKVIIPIHIYYKKSVEDLPDNEYKKLVKEFKAYLQVLEEEK